jgi:hypothetical protein
MLNGFGCGASVVSTLALACALGRCAPLAAQDAVLDEFYGAGVHQYFSGNPAQAVSDLTAAISGGSKDPRVYYFRALAELRLGQQSQATADLQRGSALESTDVNQFYPVGKSLERVQGSARLTIERYRALARAEAHQRQQQRDAMRYEQRRRAETQVLRAPAVAAPAPASAPRAAAGAPPAPGPAVPATDDPFADTVESAPAGDKPAADAAAEEMPAEDSDAAAPAAEAPADDDPFGDPPAADDAGATSDDAGGGAEAKSDEADPFGDETEGK